MLSFNVSADTLGAFIDSIPEQQATTDWIVQTTGKNVDKEKAAKIVSAAYANSYSAGINPMLTLAIIYVESKFNKNAKSVEGAIGLTQIIPRFHKDKLKGRNIVKSEHDSIEVGLIILKDCLNRFNNDMGLALGKCYSGGGGKKYYNKVVTYQKQLHVYSRLNKDDSVVVSSF